MESMKIVGIVHVDVDGATYSTAARAEAEYHARQKGVSFLYGELKKPDLERADNCPTMHVSMAGGLPNWGYTVWLVG
jgi:hypothetical protein